MEQRGLNIHLTRRRFLEWGIGLGAGIALAACSGDNENSEDSLPTDATNTSDSASNGSSPEVSAPSSNTDTTSVKTSSDANQKTYGLYVPATWETNRYDSMTDLQPQSFNHLLLSFAEPNPRTGAISPVPIDDSTKSFIHRVAAPNSVIALAIGGWGGSDSAHENNLKGFTAAAANAEGFAANVKSTVETMRQESGLAINGIDLDWEYPDQPGDPARIVAIAKAIKSIMGDTLLSIAVPSYVGAESYAQTPELWKIVDRINLMTYDYDLDGSGTAKSIAPTEKVTASVAEWAALLGNEEKLIVGLPNYGHTFPKAKKAGDTSETGEAINYTDMDQAKIAAIAATDAEPGYAGTDAQGWISVMPPLRIAETVRQVRANHPNIGGFFYWSAHGQTQAHTDAMRVA